MVNILYKLCLECKQRAIFNYENEQKAIYCLDHKKEGMINIVYKTCLECNRNPSFNAEGEIKGIYCSHHKKEGMVNVSHRSCLECRKSPIFNNENEKKGIYCFDHKKEGMVDVKNKKCKTHLCSMRFQKKYDGYCLFCYVNLFPEKKLSRNYKTKEFAVIEYIKEKLPELSWKSDKTIQDGCSKRRPDLLLDLGYQIIIVEVDENQHIKYDCSCENKRIMELSQDLQHRPIIFIRFNPDEYIKNNNTISSCWESNKKGILIIKKSKTDEWKSRLEALYSQIEYWLDPKNQTNKTIEIVQLFYNN
jgi:ferredoxin-like protein FixX